MAGFGAATVLRDDGRVSTTSTPAPQPVDPAGPEGSTSPRKSAYSMGSMPNMLRSLLVILGLVGVLIAIVPRVSSVEQPAVDAASVVADAARQSGLPFEAPVGLPSGWKATSARYDTNTDQLLTWQGGWTTPRGGYVAIRQTKTASPNWLRVATTNGQSQGTVEASGRTWQKLYDAEHDRTSLVTQPSQPGTGVVTVVTATAGLDEVLLFTNALKPAQP